jgi:hypothetical protein
MYIYIYIKIKCITICNLLYVIHYIVRAYYPEIFERSGAPALVEKYGNWFTHENTPRAQIFRREHSKVNINETKWV